jgi:signal transduction histidine kinase
MNLEFRKNENGRIGGACGDALAYLNIGLYWKGDLLPVHSLQFHQLFTMDSNATNSEEILVQRDKEMLTLFKISEIFQSARPLDELYNDIVEEICTATGFPIVTIAITDTKRQRISFRGAKGLPIPKGQSLLEMPFEDTFSGTIVKTGKPLIIDHASELQDYRSTILEQLGAQTFIGYPMVVGGKIIGAISLAHANSIPLSEQTKRWIQTLANYVAALTERKQAEEELRNSHDQLRNLAAHLRSAVEDERKSIAREIHDELGQELSLLQLELGLVESRLRADQKELRKRTKVMSKLIDSAIQTIQRISSDLRPTLLDNLGIGAAVEWQTKEFQRRTKIACEVSIIPPEIKLDQDRSTALFRILQEALTNIARHAHATSVTVVLAERNAGVELTVIDNGIGIVPERIADARSFGLIGMRERVYQLDGTVTVTGTPREGTQVRVSIPRKS